MTGAAAPGPRLQVLALPGGDRVAEGLAHALGTQPVAFEHRRFPDGERYLRLPQPLASAAVLLAADLVDPDPQAMGLLFAADTLRELGAKWVGLAAPYLPYMRQDARFLPGEAVTSRSFARFVSRTVDALVTVDPHLHRHASLGEIYTIPTRVVPAAPRIAAWLRREVGRPLVVGPDEESAQWAQQVADATGCPWRVMRKQRRGDREVSLELPALDDVRDRTPVLIDDIVSSGHTMAEAVGLLTAAGLPPAVCLAVHGLFAPGARALLQSAGAARVVTCNTVGGDTARIDVLPDLAAAALALAPA